jgi:transposase
VPNPRLLITAVVLEGRTQAEVARRYDVSQAWLSELVTRYRVEARPPSTPARGARPAARPPRRRPQSS